MMRNAARRASQRLISNLVHSPKSNFHSNAALCQAVPAVIPVPQSSGGFFSNFFGSKQAVLPPLSEPLPDVKQPPPFEAPEKISTEITQFKNGFRIASENIPGPSSVISLFVNTGPMHETAANSGVSHLLEKMAFKSTLNRSHFRLVRELQALGIEVEPSSSREVICYTVKGLKTHIPESLEILADSILNPAFHEWELKEQVDNILKELNNLPNLPQVLLIEALHGTAFAGPLGNPLLADANRIQTITPSILRDFVENNFTAPRLILSAAGANHEELVSFAKPYFETLPKVEVKPLPSSEYVGGDWRVSGKSEFTQVAIAFEVKGGWKDIKDSCIAHVVQMLLGGGGSFSAGGPGKGLYSRLYSNVLRQYNEVDSCSAFSNLYDTTGLIGVYLTAPPEKIGGLCGVVCEELVKLTQPKSINDVELDRAKNATIGLILMLLESKSVIAEDIGRQVLTYGNRKNVFEYIDLIKSITKEDVNQFASKFLSTPPTVVSYGDITHVPRYDLVARFFA